MCTSRVRCFENCSTGRIVIFFSTTSAGTRDGIGCRMIGPLPGKTDMLAINSLLLTALGFDFGDERNNRRDVFTSAYKRWLIESENAIHKRLSCAYSVSCLFNISCAWTRVTEGMQIAYLYIPGVCVLGHAISMISAIASKKDRYYTNRVLNCFSKAKIAHAGFRPWKAKTRALFGKKLFASLSDVATASRLISAFNVHNIETPCTSIHVYFIEREFPASVEILYLIIMEIIQECQALAWHILFCDALIPKAQ